MEAGSGCVGVRGGCAAISVALKALLSLDCSLAIRTSGEQTVMMSRGRYT